MSNIGKTLYRAKVRDNKILVESNTVVEESRNYCYFIPIKDAHPIRESVITRCLKTDVGVVCFLTKKEAIEYLISKLKHSIEMGKKYIEMEQKHLAEAQALLE